MQLYISTFVSFLKMLVIIKQKTVLVLSFDYFGAYINRFLPAEHISLVIFAFKSINLVKKRNIQC